MSAARSDLVNAVELASRSASLERRLELAHMPRLREAGALEGTRASAHLTFGTFEKRPTIELALEGRVVQPCQRCLRPMESHWSETAQLIVVGDDSDDVPGGYEPVIGDAERLPLTELIEEQLLLGMPMVPVHAEAGCNEAPAAKSIGASHVPSDERQRPFANLRELLDKGEH
jgi:uncharacterized protein